MLTSSHTDSVSGGFHSLSAVWYGEYGGNYSATSNNMNLVHRYIWYSEEGSGRAVAPPSPLLAVPNVTAHTSAASVPIIVLLHNGLLLCGFNVPIKG